jgi:hypothetical protein
MLLVRRVRVAAVLVHAGCRLTCALIEPTRVSSGHPLLGQARTIVVQARPQDEVVVTTDSAVYLVHLTWTRRPERPPYPRALAFRSAAEFEDVIKYRY